MALSGMVFGILGFLVGSVALVLSIRADLRARQTQVSWELSASLTPHGDVRVMIVNVGRDKAMNVNVDPADFLELEVRPHTSMSRAWCTPGFGVEVTIAPHRESEVPDTVRIHWDGTKTQHLPTGAWRDILRSIDTGAVGGAVTGM